MIEHIQVRPMTRRQMRMMREAGADPRLLAKSLTGDALQDQVASAELSERMMDFILANVYPEYDFDDVPYHECAKLALQTFRLTMYGDEDALKNSEISGSGTQSEQNTAEIATKPHSKKANS